MSTRGLWGYVIGGELKATYNHSDSYPDGMGANLVRHVKEYDRDQMVDDVLALQLVQENGEKPTREQIDRLGPVYANQSVSSGDLDEWYVLLRRTQGNPKLTLAAGYMIDGANFAYDSLFCEWGYIIDLDAGTFEVYQGFVGEPHKQGRFAEKEIVAEETHHYPPYFDGDDRDVTICVRCNGKKDTSDTQKVCPGEDYPYPIKMIASFDLNDLPDTPHFVKEVMAKSRYAEGEEE